MIQELNRSKNDKKNGVWFEPRRVLALETGECDELLLSQDIENSAH